MGAGTIILPGVEIGDNVVIGAGNVVSKSIPSNSVAVGNPAHVIGTYEDYIAKRRIQMQERHCYDYSYTINKITPEKRIEMVHAVERHEGGFVQ